MFGSFF